MSVRYLKLVDALRQNDLPQITREISQIEPGVQSYGSPLHLSILLSTKQTIEHILHLNSNGKNDDGLSYIITQNENGETPLHVCARLGRQDILDILFDTKEVDETIRNSLNQLPIDQSKTPLITQKFQSKLSLSPLP